MNHDFFMKMAIEEARIGLAEGGIPIGSILVCEGQVLGRGRNRRIQNKSAILHAEMDCLENAGRLRSGDYRKCVIYSTLSPCDMCTGAILLYQIPLVVIGENENFRGPEDHSLIRGVQLKNIQSEECKQLMRDFISEQPALWNEDIGT
ncbi:MAG: creatinine deaminase [Candidatus Omnitrophota bacterium]|jgi:creatinine deaminase